MLCLVQPEFAHGLIIDFFELLLILAFNSILNGFPVFVNLLELVVERGVLGGDAVSVAMGGTLIQILLSPHWSVIQFIHRRVLSFSSGLSGHWET